MVSSGCGAVGDVGEVQDAECTCYQLTKSNEPDAIQECVYCLINRIFDPAYVSQRRQKMSSGKRIKGKVHKDQGRLI